jgi:hypothetical protein
VPVIVSFAPDQAFAGDLARGDESANLLFGDRTGRLVIDRDVPVAYRGLLGRSIGQACCCSPELFQKPGGADHGVLGDSLVEVILQRRGTSLWRWRRRGYPIARRWSRGGSHSREEIRGACLPARSVRALDRLPRSGARVANLYDILALLAANLEDFSPNLLVADRVLGFAIVTDEPHLRDKPLLSSRRLVLLD